MSLILEALKKSEAERRLGQAPGLMTPMPTTRATRPIGPASIAIALVVAAGVGAAGWWLTRDTPDSRARGAVPSPTSASKPSNQTIATSATESGSAAEATQRIDPALEAEAREILAPASPDFTSTERESTPLAAEPDATTDLRPLPTESSHAPKAVPSPRVAPIGAPAPAPEVEPITTPAPASTAPPTDVTATAQAVPASAPLPDIPRLDQLPSTERDALPPLKLSMHVYADSAPNRFVLIDGRRYGEGEKLAPTLQVVEIRREGVVLDFNGHRFLLLRP